MEHAWQKREIHSDLWWQTLKEEGTLTDLGTGGNMILNRRTNGALCNSGNKSWDSIICEGTNLCSMESVSQSVSCEDINHSENSGCEPAIAERANMITLD
jgi:hypothetical protein